VQEKESEGIMRENEIGFVIDEFYRIISREKGEKKDWKMFRDLFYENARLGPYRKNDNGESITILFSVDEYIERLEKFLGGNSFYEISIKKRVECYNDIGSVYDEYCAYRDKERNEIVKKGINLISLIKSSKRWKIINMIWQDIK
jgi:hypothetical protein